jgi:hypothetical protein
LIIYRLRVPELAGADIVANSNGRSSASQKNSLDEAVIAERLATSGLHPKRVGERVVDAIRRKRSTPLSVPFPPK